MNKQGLFRIGIDLGGTKIEIAVLDEDYRVLQRDRIPTEADKGYIYILENIARLFSKVSTPYRGKIASVGLGAPGALSLKSGMLKNSNTQCLNNQPLQTDLSRLLGFPIRIENDANCFALAEAVLGAGKNLATVFGIIIGTGCGGGLILNQKIHQGLQHIGGEWGHMTIDPLGPECYCGQRGCVETYISGGGLERQYFVITHQHLSSSEIWESYHQGQKDAQVAIAHFFEAFGRSIGNLINILDPEMIVMGGGLSNQPLIYTLGVQAVSKHIFGNDFNTPIVKNILGDSAGVVGAALL